MEPRKTIPNDVMEKLRAEVGYGCPICRSPFLTFHHFDPPHNVRPHNDPDGMIALCDEHHKEANNDNWPLERLRALKTTLHSTKDVKGTFPSWEHENILVRLGGNYTGGPEVVVAIQDQPFLRLRRNSVGLLALSFDLQDSDGTPLLRLVDNTLELHPTGVHDFIVTPGKRKIKLWLGKRDLGLDLTFERITIEKLEMILGSDFERSKKIVDRLLKKARQDMDERNRDFIEEYLSGRSSVPSWIDSVDPKIREQVREGYLTGDMIGPWVKKWARENCFQGDGKLPFFNFKNLSFFFRGKRLRIRDGLALEGLRIGYSCFFDNARGAINLPLPV